LKNKKGAKQQKFIQQVVKQVQTPNLPNKKTDAEAKKKLEEETLALFKPVAAAQKVEKGIKIKTAIPSCHQSVHTLFCTVTSK